MDDDEDDFHDSVCDVVWWYCDVILHVMLCCDIVFWCMCCDVVCDGVWDVVCDGVSGGECCGKVKWMILSCLGVLVTDGRTDIGGCRVAFATENRGFSEFGTISLRTPPPYTNSEKHNSENWSIFLIPSLPIEIVNKTLNYIIKFVTFESTEWKLNPNNASNVYIRSDWIVFHDNF